jgi:nitroreductase
MDIIEAIRNRRSIRSYKPDPVPKEVLEELLDACRWAPSGGNVQPWHFAVLGGKVMDEAKARLEEKAKASWDGTGFKDMNPDFPRRGAYPESLVSRVEAQRERMNSSVFFSEGEDPEQNRNKFMFKMLRFFDAPNAIIIYTDDESPTAMGAIGIVSQTICLAALAYGLGTCIMGYTIMWPDIYRELLGIPKGKPIATSMAIGYPELEAQINTFPRLREPLDVLTDWHGV